VVLGLGVFVLAGDFGLVPNYQCCGSGIFIPDHDFYPFRIPDPKTATKEKDEKKFVVKRFFVATNFTKL
jgi:hypothetical protein